MNNVGHRDNVLLLPVRLDERHHRMVAERQAFSIICEVSVKALKILEHYLDSIRSRLASCRDGPERHRLLQQQEQLAFELGTLRARLISIWSGGSG